MRFLKKLTAYTFAVMLAMSAMFSTAIAGDPMSNVALPSPLWGGNTGGVPQGFSIMRTVTAFKTVSAVTITASQTLWTPTAGTKFRLMAYCLTQTTASGNITLSDGGVAFLIIPANTLGQTICFNLPANGYVSTATGNTLTAIGVSTEVISGTLYGLEE